MTAYYVAVTFTAAVVGGVLIGRLGLEDDAKDVRVADDSSGSDRSGALATDGGTVDCGCGDQAATTRTHRQRFGAAAREAVSFLVETLPYLLLGMTVLAFVVGGAGVSIPNLLLLNKLFERRLLAVYAATVVTIGVLVGVLFNAVLV